mmetsp:Transcript_15174/g.37801  ORF Transcript_15174/g.37801 Transcript_15174/m.37801 type:complete len:237 (+) Transcript_15174:431-1141(+)
MRCREASVSSLPLESDEPRRRGIRKETTSKAGAKISMNIHLASHSGSQLTPGLDNFSFVCPHSMHVLVLYSLLWGSVFRRCVQPHMTQLLRSLVGTYKHLAAALVLQHPGRPWPLQLWCRCLRSPSLQLNPSVRRCTTQSTRTRTHTDHPPKLSHDTKESPDPVHVTHGRTITPHPHVPSDQQQSQGQAHHTNPSVVFSLHALHLLHLLAGQSLPQHHRAAATVALHVRAGRPTRR